MSKFWRKVVITTLVGLSLTTVAKAEKRKVYSYSVPTVYSTAIRLLRVDLNFEIIEKDPEGGFVIFNYVDTANKKHRGSLELLNKTDEGKLTQAICSIPDVPSYLEMDFLEKLNTKLVTDHR